MAHRFTKMASRPGGSVLRLVAALLATTALGACSPDSSSEKAKAPAAVPVTVAAVMQKTVPVRIQAVGNVEPIASVAVKSRVDGQIVAVGFKDGEDVAKGQVLFRLDPRPFEAQLRQAEATQLKDQAQVTYTRGQEQRYQDLLQRNFVSREAYAQVRANREAAEALVRADQANVDTARLQLAYATIHAPIAGRAGRIMVTAGNLVKANDTTALVLINQIAPIYVSFAVPEQTGADIRRRLAQGNLAVEALPRTAGAKPVSGRLAFIDNAVDAATGTLKLRAEFVNADRSLWPGDFAETTLTLGEEPDVIVAPARAILNGPKGTYVFVLQSDNKVAVRPVSVARSAGDEAVIATGLKAGEQVVTDGASRLKNGTLVQVKNGNTPS